MTKTKKEKPLPKPKKETKTKKKAAVAAHAKETRKLVRKSVVKALPAKKTVVKSSVKVSKILPAPPRIAPAPAKIAPAPPRILHHEKKAEAPAPPPVFKPAQKPPLIHEIKKEPPKITPKPKEEIREVKKETALPQAAPPVELKELELELPITLKDLAVKLQEKPSVLIKSLMNMKIMVGINQTLEESVAIKICQNYGYQIKKALDEEELALRRHKEVDKPGDLRPRSPIVTFMGHVDHGKTSLLDAIRKTKVTESEHGGITQHIGAYRVILPGGEITFLDTPGHEAFTAMRARGASITDIVVLVVAADDGVMPQTKEAIDHARAASVPIVVAMNKIDKPQANPDKLKKQLAELDLTAEDWGGKTIVVPVSAKTGQGIDQLLEMILLEAQMLELKANPRRHSYGVVVEAKLTKGKGPVATLLVQNGTLHLNENIVVGNYYGKIRAMFNDRGQSVTEAGPSFPVEVLGISAIPQAGEQFFVIEDDRTAKELAGIRQEKAKKEQVKAIKRISLEDLHAQIQEGKIKELNLIIKADVGGSLEAIKDTLDKLNVSEIKLNIIHDGVGSINSSDVILAVASNALILGFNCLPDEPAKELIAKEGVEVKTYNIIYELASDIKAAVEGMLEPTLKKIFLGRAEVRKVFKLSRAGTVAGCFVTKGKINRTASVSLLRNGQPIFEGKLSSLKRFKDDVREVAEGFECGITLAGFDQLMEGDLIEAYDIERIARRL